MNTKTIQQILDEQRRESKIHKASAKQIAANERNFDPSWYDPQVESLARVRQTEEYQQNFQDAMERRRNDPTYKQQVQEAVRRRDSKPGRLEEQADIMRRVRSQPGFDEKMQQMFASEEWLEKNRSKSWKTYKPLVTDIGAFPSLNHCVVYYMEQNLLPTRTTHNSVVKWLHSKMKKEPNIFYYISREEYIILTGKDVI